MLFLVGMAAVSVSGRGPLLGLLLGEEFFELCRRQAFGILIEIQSQRAAFTKTAASKGCFAFQNMSLAANRTFNLLKFGRARRTGFRRLWSLGRCRRRIVVPTIIAGLLSGTAAVVNNNL